MLNQQEQMYPKNWKEDFLKRPENAWFCAIPDEYITEHFNLYGIEDEDEYKFSYFEQDLRVITNSKSLAKLPESIRESVKRELPILYGKIHARFILSPEGIKQVKAKYKNHEYGLCPRVGCQNEPLLPIGITCKLKKSRVKGYCPRCRRVYIPNPVVTIDGGFFGPSCPHIIVDELKIRDRYKEFEPYERQAFGFRVYDPAIHELSNEKDK